MVYSETPDEGDYDRVFLIERLNIFAQHGYEAVGITSVNTVKDVWLLCYTGLCNQSPAQIVRRMRASTRADLLIVFLEATDVHQWESMITRDNITLYATKTDERYANDPYHVYLRLQNVF